MSDTALIASIAAVATPVGALTTFFVGRRLDRRSEDRRASRERLQQHADTQRDLITRLQDVLGNLMLSLGPGRSAFLRHEADGGLRLTPPDDGDFDRAWYTINQLLTAVDDTQLCQLARQALAEAEGVLIGNRSAEAWVSAMQAWTSAVEEFNSRARIVLSELRK